MTQFNNEFEESLKSITVGSPDQDGKEWKRAIVNVADNAYMAKLWFKSQGVQYTAFDLMEFAKQVNAELDLIRLQRKSDEADQ